VPSKLVQRLGAFQAAAALAERQPWEWQQEAAAALAGLLRPAKAPPGLEGWVADQRAAAELSVRQAAAKLLRDAVRKAQQAKRKTEGEAVRYGVVSAAEVYAQVSHELVPMLALGPKRDLFAALKDAATLLGPDELWRDGKRGWRSLGLKPGQRPAAPAQLQARATRTRSGLLVTREVPA
jgi:hypothetical protein